MRDAGNRLGVFAGDPPLRTFQAYTADREAIRHAIDAATSSGPRRNYRGRPGRGALDASTSPTAGAASGGRPNRDRAVSQAEESTPPRPPHSGTAASDQPGVVVDLLVERTTQRMDESYKEFERDGYGQNASVTPCPRRFAGASAWSEDAGVLAEDFAVPDAPPTDAGDHRHSQTRNVSI